MVSTLAKVRKAVLGDGRRCVRVSWNHVFRLHNLRKREGWVSVYVKAGPPVVVEQRGGSEGEGGLDPMDDLGEPVARREEIVEFLRAQPTVLGVFRADVDRLGVVHRAAVEDAEQLVLWRDLAPVKVGGAVTAQAALA